MKVYNIKEKGDELINKFYNTGHHNNSVAWRQIQATQSAIIAVEEILAVNHGNAWSHIPGVTIKEYWNEVLTYLKSKQ